MPWLEFGIDLLAKWYFRYYSMEYFGLRVATNVRHTLKMFVETANPDGSKSIRMKQTETEKK